MWISQRTQQTIELWREQNEEARKLVASTAGNNQRLQVENARLRADLDWFKLRLNQVERERGMLIQAAIGVKIAVPEFVPTFDPSEALNPLGNPFEDLAGSGVALDPKEDYSMMPGFGKR